MTEQKPGLKAVAELAGVGYATASRALSGRGYVAAATRKKVRAAAKTLGYKPNLLAKALREDRTNLVGVILPNLINEFYSEATEAIQRELVAAGYQMLVVAAGTAELQDRAVQSLLQNKVAGIIQVPVAGAKATDAVPLVQLNRDQLPGVPAVLANDAHGFAELTALLSHKYRRIAAIMGDPALSTTQAREQGIRQANTDVIFSHGTYDANSGREQAAHLLDGPEAAGLELLIVTSPRLMAGVLTELQRRGMRVPQDIAVSGYDDPEWYEFFGSGITTFSLDHEGMGRRVAQRLIGLLREDGGVGGGASSGAEGAGDAAYAAEAHSPLADAGADSCRAAADADSAGAAPRVEHVPGRIIRRGSA